MTLPEEFTSLEFHAKRVVADGATKNLGFCNQFDVPQDHYFLIARDECEPFDYTDDLGEIYIERDDQCWGGYGGIKQVILERNRLTVEFGPRMKRQLGYDEIRVTFEVESERFEEIRSVLGFIMQGYESRVTFPG